MDFEPITYKLHLCFYNYLNNLFAIKLNNDNTPPQIASIPLIRPIAFCVILTESPSSFTDANIEGVHKIMYKNFIDKPKLLMVR